MQGRLVRLCSESFSEEDFFRDAAVALAEGEEVKEEREEEVEGLRLELGWLVRTRRFLGLAKGEAVGRYLREI